MKLGKLQLQSKYILAPMAGFTDVGFRCLAYSFGAGLCTTEMVSAKGILYNNTKTHLLLSTDEEEPIKSVQLFAKETSVLEKAVQSTSLEKFDVIDLNFGCPMKKIVSNGEGAALMQNPSLIYDLVKACVDNTDKVITAKIRAGFASSDKNAVTVAQYIEKAGAQAITVHGRTKDMFYTGDVDLDVINKVVEEINIPVFGNGDVTSIEQARIMLEKTNCAGVAVGRGALGTPELFATLNGLSKTYSKGEQIRAHIKKYLQYVPEKLVVNYMKKHLAAYLKGVENAKEIKTKIYVVKSIPMIYSLMQEYNHVFEQKYLT